MCGSSASVPGPVASHGALLRDGAHLWWGRIGDVESLDAAWGWLSDEERRRGERFHRPRDARAFVLRRAFLRGVLAGYVGCTPAEVEVVAGPFGKPRLACGPTGLAFSASSRGGLALVGVASGAEIGVDLEEWPSPLVSGAEEIARLARQVATEGERARLLARPAAELPRAFLALWTRKEAYLKALGTGLSREPATVEVGWSAGEGPRDARWLEVVAPAGFLASAVLLPGTAAYPPHLLSRPRTDEPRPGAWRPPATGGPTPPCGG